VPSLDSALQTFVNWQTLLFCLGIAILTYVVRTIVETLWKGAATNDVWQEFGVRLGPIGTGMILGVTMRNFPWPTVLAGSKWALLFYGAACGVASAYVYAAFKAWLGVAAKNGFQPAQRLMKKSSTPPPAAEEDIHERPTDPPPTPRS
jgi:hypothetical protein